MEITVDGERKTYPRPLTVQEWMDLEQVRNQEVARIPSSLAAAGSPSVPVASSPAPAAMPIPPNLARRARKPSRRRAPRRCCSQ